MVPGDHAVHGRPPGARGVERRVEGARRLAVGDDRGDGRLHRPQEPLVHAPVLLHGGGDHVVQAAFAEEQFQLAFEEGAEQAAQAVRGGTGAGGDGLELGAHRAQHALGDRLVDRALRGVEAIDVGRGHAQFARDVGDRGLLVAHAAEQALRRLLDPGTGRLGAAGAGGGFGEAHELTVSFNR
jgi:hypothetical protein